MSFVEDGLETFNLDDLSVEEPTGPIDYPLLPVRDTVVFPRILSPLFVGRDQSVRAVEAALDADSRLIVATQRDPEVENPSLEDLHSIGAEIVIGRILRMPDGSISILAHGRRRVELIEFVQTTPFVRVQVRPLPEVAEVTLSTEALMRAVLALFEKCVQLDRNLPDDAYVAAMNINEPGWLADTVTSLLDLEVEKRQEILSILDPSLRLQSLSIILSHRLDVLELESDIQSKIQQEVDKGQREYYLREQMRVIQSELGEIDTQLAEISELREKLEQVDMPEEARAKAERELSRLAAMPPAAPEVGIIRTYLDWIFELPWTKETEDNTDIRHVSRVLDAHHYGLPDAKDRILEHIAVRQRAGDKMRTPILCFVGPPGTGKTSLGRSIAEALGRGFVRVSLGGIRDEAEIRGHRRTYIGALPGRIVQTIRRVGSKNPVIMLDEVDKIGADWRGDPSSALLEVLDPEQNREFRDHYMDVAFDLSQVMFITTANVLDTIPGPLRDRMEILQLSGYTEEEKTNIAKGYLVPRQIRENGLRATEISFTDEALRTIIRDYTREAGVRSLERQIGGVCRKVATKVAEGKIESVVVDSDQVSEYLGKPVYFFEAAERCDQPGVATGLSVTAVGGDILFIEATKMPGQKGLTITGQLGEVMKESAQAALSYVRSQADRLGFDQNFFDKSDIHVHVPAGAVPKDGPSAGVTIATALASLLTGRPVRADVGMTGEITLRGQVLPVGGIKEKALAAHRAGLRTVIIPKRNERDLDDLPEDIRDEMTFVLVDRVDEVLVTALRNGHVSETTQSDDECSET